MIEIFDKNDQRVPILLWMETLDDLEPTTLQQALNLSVLPFAHHHIALMPDAHQGYGMPIGGVLAAKNAVVPYAVGMDIGCGMRAARTRIKTSDLSREKLNLFIKGITRTIPQGFNWHKKAQSDPVFEELPDEIGIIASESKNVRKQLGTLGGGNHFIEFQRDPENNLWVMIHSGSRNIGKQVAEHFHKRAVKACKSREENLPTTELSFFHLDSKDGEEYVTAMNWCLKFAKANRSRMMETVLDIIGETPAEMIDIHHNYAVMEEHFGKKVMLHRKGATKAEKGVKGIVPGSMGSNSYITVGLGKPESFISAAHGAGRRMGRNAARRQIPIERVLREMEEKGIALAAASRKDLAEECTEAYKDIDEVMRNQKDLVSIVTVLKPIGVVKG